jgi:hypothetical protein
MITCPNCGAATISAWDKLMCGLIGRRCWCERCRQSSREVRTKRLVTSILFLASLWLMHLITHPGYQLAAMGIWAVLLIVVEWRYVHTLPLVPAIDSPRWKRVKDVFAWSFVALIVATFVFAAVFNAA